MSYPRRGIDPCTVATTKLSQDWSANRVVPHINAKWLTELVQDERFPGIDPMVKIRLLLASLVAANQQQQAQAQPHHQQQAEPGSVSSSSSAQAAGSDLHEALSRLQQAAAADADEWVKIMAAAAGQLDGRLDMDAVLQHSAVVQETMSNLQQQVEAAAALREQQQQQQERASVEPDITQLFPPLEDLYLTTRPSVLNTDPAPFRLKESPAVQPLSTNVSYSAATPPPALLRQGLGRTSYTGDAAFLRPQNKQQHALERKGSSLARTISGSQQLKPGTTKQQAVQVLDEEEQKRMMAAQTEMLRERHPRTKDTAKLGLGLQAKHGFALSGIRHEDVPQPSPKPDRPRAAADTLPWSQQQLQHQQPGRPDRAAAASVSAEEGKEEDQEEEPADADAGGQLATPFAEGQRRSSTSSGRQGGRRLRQTNVSARDAAAAVLGGDGPGNPAGAVAAAVEEEMMRDLFEDDDGDEGDEGLAAPAATGLSRSARGALQSHLAEADQADMPAELQDELEDDEEGEAQEQLTGAGGGAAGDALGLQRFGSGLQQQQVQHHDRAALSAKRSRRVLDSDDDD